MASPGHEATADLSDDELSGGQVVRFALRPEDKSIDARLPDPLPTAVQRQAETAGIPCQRIIHMALEGAATDQKT